MCTAGPLPLSVASPASGWGKASAVRDAGRRETGKIGVVKTAPAVPEIHLFTHFIHCPAPLMQLPHISPVQQLLHTSYTLSDFQVCAKPRCVCCGNNICLPVQEQRRLTRRKHSRIARFVRSPITHTPVLLMASRSSVHRTQLTRED